MLKCHGEKVFLYIQSEPLLFHFTLFLVLPPPEEPDSYLHNRLRYSKATIICPNQ